MGAVSGSAAMCILLVAYDFPPTRSPRALRWFYLTRELALHGHDVHVLVPDLGPAGVDFPRSPGRVTVHRSFPGPFAWLSGFRQRRRGRCHGSGGTPSLGAAQAHLNWRGRLSDSAKKLAGHFVFPDVRGEWALPARRALDHLLAELKPDIVLTSHEPAVTLPLGAHANRLGFPWIADLGDPVCASYTAQRWHRRAWKLEQRVVGAADLVLVTNDATRRLLVSRHGLEPTRCEVLPNGYDDRRPRSEDTASTPFTFDSRWLELVYAGRLYGYRSPRPLLQAVSATPGVRLTMVIPDPPSGEGAAALFSEVGERLRVSGPLPHAQVLGLLERADVLVNFGDEGQPVRTPAKLFEYFGIPRPILHVHSQGADAAAELLSDVERGWISNNDPESLATRLGQLVQEKRAGRLTHGLSLEPLRDYAHSALGARLERALARIAAAREVNCRSPASQG